MKPIVKVPNDVLTSPSEAVTHFDKTLSRLITDLKETLISTKNPKGVGLAAPQIGVSLRVFVTRPHEKDPIRVFINPFITVLSEDATDGIPARLPAQAGKLEGCLSIPTIWGRVKRATSLTLQYQDELGKSHQEKFTGFLATIIQHETDHLNGTLFTHRVVTQKGKLYQTEKDDEGKEVLEEIELK
jgi:peptide deformylase